MTVQETPPRAWGRPLKIGPSVFPLGNTPTSVGKTSLMRCSRIYDWKHPHERGEDLELHRLKRLVAETPPRAWGRRNTPRDRQPIVGNTPTSVGKTMRAASFWRASRKHPHERGEDSFHLSFLYPSVETPPRAWGRLCPVKIYPLQLRNTPTSVGKTNLIDG